MRARRRAFETLASGLTDADRQELDGLLTNDPEVGRSRFTWLRDCPESPAPSNMVELLDRLDYVRSLGVDADRARGIHPGRLTRLVEEGGIMTAQHIADLEPARRTAILVAQVAHLDTRVADATLAMFEKYIGSLFTKARSKDERRFQATQTGCGESPAAVPAHHRRSETRQAGGRGWRGCRRARGRNGATGSRPTHHRGGR